MQILLNLVDAIIFFHALPTWYRIVVWIDALTLQGKGSNLRELLLFGIPKIQETGTVLSW
jgi:hypothetical protein